MNLKLSLRTPARMTIGLILIAFVLLATTYSLVTPIFEASDELWHYPLVQWLSQGQLLPVQDAKNVGPWKQEASQPPLYYYLTGWATSWIDTSDLAEVRRENPHADNGVITPDGNRNLVVHNPERESFPWRGTALAVHLVRLLSVLMGAATVWLTYRIALELFPDRLLLRPHELRSPQSMKMFPPDQPPSRRRFAGKDADDPKPRRGRREEHFQISLTPGPSPENEKQFSGEGRRPLPLSQNHLFDFGREGRGVRLSSNSNREYLAFSAAAINAFTPMFIFISGAVNNDNLTMTLCSLALWMMVRQLRNNEGSGIGDQGSGIRDRGSGRGAFWPAMGRWLPVGIVLGLGALTKTSALALLPIAALAISLVAWRKASWAEFFAGAIATAVPVLLIAGWWYLRNIQLYGDPTGLSAFIDVLGRRAAPASLAQLWGERWGFMLSYWGLFGGVNVPLDNWAYHVFNALAIVGVVGVIVYFVTLMWRWFRATGEFVGWHPNASARRNASNRRMGMRRLRSFVQDRAPLFLVGLFGVIVVALLTQWASVTWSSQGRLVFSAISTWSIFLALGIATVATKRFARVTLTATAIFMFGVSALAPFTTIAPAYAHSHPLPNVPAPNLALNVTFGDQLKLTGADVTAPSVQPGGAVEIVLYWQAIQPVERDYSTFVHLLDQNEIVVAQRDMYPGQGAWPTSQLKPGDIIASRYVLKAPPTAYAPDMLTWEVGVYDFATQQRLPASSGGDNVRFGSLGLVEQSGDVPNPITVNLGNQLDLIGYALDRRAAAPGESIHLTLYWRARSKMPIDYTVFTHVLQPPETIWGQQDKPLPPTSRWPLGQVVSDTYELKIKPEAPPGVYEIEVGVYEPQQFERLRIITDDGRITENFVLLSKVRVK